MKKRDTYRLIEQAAELFKIVEQDDYADGLLYPSGLNPFHYGRPALSVYMLVKKVADSHLYEFFACIGSIDDSGVSIFGPAEKIDKARSRYKKFLEFIKQQECRCPTPEELKKFCITIGVTADYW